MGEADTAELSALEPCTGTELCSGYHMEIQVHEHRMAVSANYNRSFKNINFSAFKLF